MKVDNYLLLSKMIVGVQAHIYRRLTKLLIL